MKPAVLYRFICTLFLYLNENIKIENNIANRKIEIVLLKFKMTHLKFIK